MRVASKALGSYERRAVAYRKLEIEDFFKGPPDCVFRFDGKAYTARRGEPVAISLLAHGQYILGRSLKYHRPRGLFCGRGSCGNCLARVDGRPSERLCVTAAKTGTTVEAQNVAGKAAFDLLAAVDQVFPHGLDHHHLMVHSGTLNRLTVSVARRLGGLGRLPDESPPFEPQEPELLTTDVAVVGGGPAGRAVAEVTKQRGLHTVVFEARPAALPGVRCGAPVLGLYDDSMLLVASGGGQCRVQSRAIVVATGAHEQPPGCVGNDLPGVFSRRAAEAALAHGVLPGRRVVVAVDAGSGDGLAAQADALVSAVTAAGATVTGVFGSGADTGGGTDAPLERVEGSRQVRGACARGAPAVRCDAVIHCGRPAPAYELPRQMGLEAPFVPEVGGFVPEHQPDGSTARPGVFLAGEVAGRPAAEAAEHGQQVGETVVAAMAQSQQKGEPA